MARLEEICSLITDGSHFSPEDEGVGYPAGVLFGTAGVKILASKDARKLYTNCTAAALRAKSTVMKTVTSIQENAEDIYAEAQQINEDRVADSFIDDEFEDVEDLVAATDDEQEEVTE